MKSRYKIPYTTINGEHDDNKNTPLGWTNGFWGGLMWLMYIGTHKDCYKIIGGEKGDKYLSAAINILKAMEQNWCNWSDKEDSILQMGSELYAHGIHMPIIYGDYFFTEAMLKLKGEEFLPW